MEKFGFFNSINSDRVYDAEDFALFFKKYFTNGIFNNGLAVKKNTGMNIIVSSGDANINGYGYCNTDDFVLTCSVGNGNFTRIDNVILRLDLENRTIGLMVVEGNPSSSPIAPSYQRTNVIYDLVLAQITIPAGTSEITQNMIKDTRQNSTLCGIVAGAVKQIDTTDIFSQYDAYFEEAKKELKEKFDAWFKDLNTELSGDVAGNLQAQINTIKENMVVIGECTDEELQEAINKSV